MMPVWPESQLPQMNTLLFLQFWSLRVHSRSRESRGAGGKSLSGVPTPIARPEPADWRSDLPIFVVLKPTIRRPLGVYNMSWDLREMQEGVAGGTLAGSSCHQGLSLRQVGNWQEAVQQWEMRFPGEPMPVFKGLQ